MASNYGSVGWGDDGPFASTSGSGGWSDDDFDAYTSSCTTRNGLGGGNSSSSNSPFHAEQDWRVVKEVGLDASYSVHDQRGDSLSPTASSTDDSEGWGGFTSGGATTAAQVDRRITLFDDIVDTLTRRKAFLSQSGFGMPSVLTLAGHVLYIKYPLIIIIIDNRSTSFPAGNLAHAVKHYCKDRNLPSISACRSLPTSNSARTTIPPTFSPVLFSGDLQPVGSLPP